DVAPDEYPAAAGGCGDAAAGAALDQSEIADLQEAAGAGEGHAHGPDHAAGAKPALNEDVAAGGPGGDARAVRGPNRRGRADTDGDAANVRGRIDAVRGARDVVLEAQQLVAAARTRGDAGLRLAGDGAAGPDRDVAAHAGRSDAVGCARNGAI